MNGFIGAIIKLLVFCFILMIFFLILNALGLFEIFSSILIGVVSIGLSIVLVVILIKIIMFFIS